jgi:tetratricopeptide (TPR) repeat protein
LKPQSNGIDLLLPGLSQTAYAKLGRKGKYTEVPAETHYKSGLAKMKAEDIDGAIDAFLQATYFARNGYYPEAYYWLGICYMDKHEDKKAVEALEKHLAQAIEEPEEALIALAEIHLRNERYEECDKALRSIRKYDIKTRCKVQYIYGLMSDRKGEYAQAESHYKTALGDRPWKWAKVWVLYCEAKMKQKKWQESLRELDALLKSEWPLKGMPMDRIHKDIGVCRLAIGDHQGALDNWHRALDYNRSDAEVWLQLGMLLEAEHHYSSALKNYREFLRLMEGVQDPRVQQVRDRLTKIEHMLRPNETMPTHASPSQYMRNQTGELRENEYALQDQQRRQQMQQMQRSGESGF